MQHSCLQAAVRPSLPSVKWAQARCILFQEDGQCTQACTVLTQALCRVLVRGRAARIPQASQARHTPQGTDSLPALTGRCPVQRAEPRSPGSRRRPRTALRGSQAALPALGTLLPHSPGGLALGHPHPLWSDCPGRRRLGCLTSRSSGLLCAWQGDLG